MFTKKNSAKESSSTESQRPPTETVIGAGAKFEGVFESPANVYIDGEFEGELSCTRTVVINRGAVVKASIVANTAIVHGYVVGPVHASERIQVGKTGKIVGDVKSGAVRVAEGGVLDGNCNIISPD